MKSITKGIEPPILATYKQNNPTDTWKEYKHGKRGGKRGRKIRNRLISDQHGLCAYCEIDLKQGENPRFSDFRVEHFHPKSDDNGAHNWHLDWKNLLGCCHGGSSRYVVEASLRFTSPDYSCDVPKDDNNWDNIILNPLNIPSSPRLFDYERTSGRMSVNQTNCAEAGIDPVKAQSTIDNLRLDAERLKNLRKVTLMAAHTQLTGLMSTGMSIQDARKRVAQAQLRKNSDQHWPPFFSAVRSYLGEAAEEQLTAIGYCP